MNRQLPVLPAVQVAPPPIESPPATRQVYIETYGCQMNLADSELLVSILTQAGFGIVDHPEKADVLLINTCAVREHAEERVLGRAAQLNGLRDQRPDLMLGILGCMAQHLGADLATRAPFVDLVVGPDAYLRLPELLSQTLDEPLLDLRLNRRENYQEITPARKASSTAWVPIIRGCDKFCTFCIVPFVRGRERCMAAAQIIDQVEKVAAAGFKEVTLLGQTVNSYEDGKTDFAQLLRAVAAVDGICRVRFMSPYPKDFDDRTIEAIAELPQVCPSLHLPVQSGANSQLERMRRGYTVEEYRDLVGRLRAAVPELALTTDIIVGFCGETAENFAQTVALLEEIRFDAAFLFKYSERQGTYAQKKLPDDVPEAMKLQRLQQVIELQERISYEINQQQVGRSVEVLVEGPSRRNTNGSTFFGRAAQGKVVVFPQAAPRHALVEVRLTRASGHTLFGECESGSSKPAN